MRAVLLIEFTGDHNGDENLDILLTRRDPNSQAIAEPFRCTEKLRSKNFEIQSVDCLWTGDRPASVW